MKALVKTISCVALALVVLAVSAYSGRNREVSWTFEKKQRVRASTISGDCIVKKGDGDQIQVEVVDSYYPRDSFEPEVRETTRELKLSEKMYGSNSGSSTWMLTVPDGTEIALSTASGDLVISDLTGEFSAETASGSMEIENCKGDFDFATASGDIDLTDCAGVFELSTASGTIDVSDVVIEHPSSFTTASGTVEVQLGRSAKHDLHLGSASGRAVLDYNGNPMEGTFEFVAKDRSGRISSPVDFDDEETFHRWGDRYVRKSFTRGGDDPYVTIETASGRAVLRDR